MSSTNWSDWMFIHHIPIHDHSWRPVKTDRDNGSFIIFSLTEYQEALSEGQFGKQKCDTLSGADVRARWYWFVHLLGTLPILFWNISLDKET